jgi:hypothetical protein
LLSAILAHASEAARPRLALVPFEARIQTAGDWLTAGLSADNRIALLERAQLD